MRRRRVLGLLAAFGLAACSAPTMEGDAQRAVEAQALYADLVEGRDDALLARMSSVNDPATVRAQLPMIRRIAPAGPAPEAKRAATERRGSTYRMPWKSTPTGSTPTDRSRRSASGIRPSPHALS